MNVKITLIALLISASISAQAQTSSEKYQPRAEMSEQMQLIVNELGLESAEIQQLGQMMEKKRLQKESMLKQIDELKKDMHQLEVNSEKLLRGMLTDKEWQKYQAEIKPKLDKMEKERLEKLDD